MAKQRQKISSVDKISVKELLEMIPDDLIDDLVEQFMVDKWVRKLKAGYFFKLILFSILNSERLSLRIMEENFEDPLFRALAPAIATDEVTWNGIRERLINVKSVFFQKLYEAVYEKAQALYGGERLSGYHIRKYDSTMIATFSHLLEGMKVGNTKKGKTQVKLTTEFRDDFLIKMEFHQDQAHLSEETALKEIIQNVPKEKQDIRVFDRGLKSRETFDLLEDEGTLFVTRLHYNARYEVLRPYRPNDLGVILICADKRVKSTNFVDGKIKQKVHKILTNHHYKNKRKYSKESRFAQGKMGNPVIIW